MKDRMMREFNAIDVPDTPLNPEALQACEVRRGGSGRKVRRAPVRTHVVKTLLAACVVLVLALGTALAVDSGLRDFVISLFQSGQVETPPVSPSPAVQPSGAADHESSPAAPTEMMDGFRCLGVQEIEGIATIHYYAFDRYFEIHDGTASMTDETGARKAYRLEGETAVELPLERVDDTFEIGGLEMELHFAYARDQGKIKVFNEDVDSPVDGWVTALGGDEQGDFIWVSVVIRDPLDLGTYVRYNLKTGEVRDIRGDAGIWPMRDDLVEFSPDRSKMLIVSSEKTYLVDAETGEVRELTELAGNDRFGATFIDNESLAVCRNQGGEFPLTLYTMLRYDIASGEQTEIFENMPFYNPAAKSYTGFTSMGMGSGVFILVEPGQYTLVDGKTGARYPIEGITPVHNDLIGFTLSPDRRRVLMYTHGVGAGGLGVAQIGVIQLGELELKVFDRKDFTSHESMMYWNNENQLVIQARENEADWSSEWYCYVYTFQ